MTRGDEHCSTSINVQIFGVDFENIKWRDSRRFLGDDSGEPKKKCHVLVSMAQNCLPLIPCFETLLGLVGLIKNNYIK
jgi:hypothetical protein